ncbi:hypothetical protein ABZ234_08310 [Nocardiopsis sp. NPDC006198]|uniref:hypothetical protein n=1 Tax=Nocardiopsis sp. NPDC006198 TaxID=3154472 RepID=UPI0033BEED70
MAEDTPDTPDTPDALDLDNPDSVDLRFMAAYRAWYMAALTTYQAAQDGPLVVLLGAAPAELSWAVELDTTWQALAGDDYRLARDATAAAPILSALAAAHSAWGLLAGLHLSDAEAATAAEAVCWRPVEDLPPADPAAVTAYSEHLQGRSLKETATALTDLFVHTPQVLTGKAEKIVRMLLPPQEPREQDQPLIEQARSMATEHPELVEIEQRAQGFRHLTVVHGEIEDPENPPHEYLSASALLSLFSSPPPPYFLGHGSDRFVVVVGGPRADRTILTLEKLLRTLAPQTKADGDEGTDWEIIRRFAPGDPGPQVYITNGTDSAHDEDAPPEQ